MLPAAAVVLAGAVVAAVRLWPAAPGSPRPGAAAHPAGLVLHASGRIVAATPAGSLAISEPDGSQVTRPAGLGNVGQQVAAAPGDRYLGLVNGQVIIVSPGPALALYPSRVPLSGNTSPAWPDPFADHSRALAMLLDYGDPTESVSKPITVVSLATGRGDSLGAGDQVAGDPQAAGVFASVARPPRPTATSLLTNPDTRIVRRDAGRPQLVLATAAAVNRDLGHASGLPVSLAVYPSPSGSELAVTVRPATGGAGTGIVVLSRAGRLVGSLAAAFGAQSVPAWSPDGTSLAFPVTGAGPGPALSVWTIGRPAATSALPGGTSYRRCIWSPDGRSVLCAGSGGTDWAIASAAGGRVAAVRGPGLPLAWLPSGGGR